MTGRAGRPMAYRTHTPDWGLAPGAPPRVQYQMAVRSRALPRRQRGVPSISVPFSLSVSVSGVALAVALTLAAVVRLRLLPLTSGSGGIAWGGTPALALRGLNGPGPAGRSVEGLPSVAVLLYLLLPLRWLSVNTGLPLAMLAKLPLLAADLAVGAVLYLLLRRARRSAIAGLVGACLYLFNPLVLYSGAVVGRFDGLALALLLAALVVEGQAFALLYGLAVAIAPVALLIVPALTVGWYRRTPRELLGAAGVALVVVAPAVVWGAHAGAVGVVSGAALGVPGPSLGVGSHGHLVVPLYALLALAAAVWRNRPPLTLCALTFGLFLLAVHSSGPAGLVWPLPFLIALALLRRDAMAWLLLAGLSATALTVSAQTTSAGVLAITDASLPALASALLALGIAAYISLTLWPRRRTGDRAETRALPSP